MEICEKVTMLRHPCERMGNIEVNMEEPTTQNKRSREPPNFSWCADGLLAACAFPRSKQHIQFLVDNGIHTLVSLSREMTVETHELDIEVVKIPMRDYTVPTQQQVEEFLDIVKTSKKLGKKVCVHCNAGNGRTGTMLACYFVREEGMSPRAAVDHVRAMRPGAMKMMEQEEFVLNFV